MLALPVLALAALTQWDVISLPPAGRVDAVDIADAPVSSRLAFGSVGAQGAIVFRVGQPVHAWAVDAAGHTRWERDFADGEYLACGPCPAAVVRHADGTVSAISATGDAAAPPSVLGPLLVRTSSPVGVVLASLASAGRVTFFAATSTGLIESGTSAGARLGQPLVAVTPAVDGGAVTIMQASADALAQGEFQLLHVSPIGETAETVALDPPTARPLPCQVTDGNTVAYFLAWGGPGADGTTRVVVHHTDAGPAFDATVRGVFDSCAVGPSGVVLANAANGEDGDLTRTVVRLVWLGPTGAVDAQATERVATITASVALDAGSRRAVVAGSGEAAVLVDGTSRLLLPPASAVAFDDCGGLWSADADGHVNRQERP